MPNVQIYSKNNCSNCEKTKQIFDEIQLPYSEIFIDQDYRIAVDMINKTGEHTVPQVFIDKVSVGGYGEILKMFGMA